MLSLFDSLIKPQLLYGSEVWGAYVCRKPTIDHIRKQVFCGRFDHELVHVKFCKSVLGVRRQTCNVAVLAELGRLPLSYTIFVSVLNFIHHITSKNNELAQLAMRAEFKNLQCGVSSYFDFPAVILKLIGVDLAELDLDSINTSFVGKMKMKVRELLERALIDELKGKSKLDLYSSLKVNFGRERYLDSVVNTNFRRAISKVRVSDHDFDIVSGRRKNIPREKRLCSLCTSGEIGSEYHVIMECARPDLKAIRFKALEELNQINCVFREFESKQIFIYCLLGNDTSLSHIVGAFLWKVMKLAK